LSSTHTCYLVPSLLEPNFLSPKVLTASILTVSTFFSLLEYIL
jgi:hypothetical protein